MCVAHTVNNPMTTNNKLCLLMLMSKLFEPVNFFRDFLTHILRISNIFSLFFPFTKKNNPFKEFGSGSFFLGIK